MKRPGRSHARYGPGTALLVVDLQNDFADPAGALYVPGGDAVVAVANREIRAALRAGSPVFYTQDWHPPHTPHFAPDGGVWPVHCVKDTWGAELVPDLEVDGAVVRKGMAGEDGYSAFAVRDPVRPRLARKTRLAKLLRARGVERVVVLGLAADCCVRETARDALRLGFDVAVVRDATQAVDGSRAGRDRALAELRAAGAHVL
jgi:nicotinamidase/pyrazinamidase